MNTMTRLILIAAALPVMAFAKEPAPAAAGLRPVAHVVRPASAPRPLVTRPAPEAPAIDPERELWRHQGVG